MTIWYDINKPKSIVPRNALKRYELLVTSYQNIWIKSGWIQKKIKTLIYKSSSEWFVNYTWLQIATVTVLNFECTTLAGKPRLL